MTQGMGHITGQDISRAQLGQVAWQRAVNQLTRLQRAIYDDQSGWLQHKRRIRDERPFQQKKATIAEKHGCCEKTVQRTFRAFERLGLLVVTIRRATQEIFRKLRKQPTNFLSLPAYEGDIFVPVSSKQRKLGSKRKVEGSIEGRRSFLKAQAAALVAAESG